MKSYKKMSAAVAAIMSMYPNQVRPTKPNVTVAELKPEYDLIQQKKSKLSRMQRDAIVAKYDYLTKVNS